MSLVIGIAGARRNAASALCDGGQIVAVCEQERITRTRRVGIPRGQLPLEALACVLKIGRRRIDEVSTYAVAEHAVELPRSLPVSRLDHHFGHAATAFWSSPFEEAVILVSDRHSGRGLSVWRGDESGIEPCDFPWEGPGFASAYSDAAEAFGFEQNGEEHRLEALARLGTGVSTNGIEALVKRGGDRLVIDASYQARIADWVGSNGTRGPLERSVEIADGLQRHLGALLLDVVAQVKANVGGRRLCVGGGLFYNSYFTTLIAESGIYDHTFVPVNPGNAGVAAGAALAACGERGARREALSPFLGPEFDPAEIKSVLDNCKLSYEYLQEGQLIGRAAEALARGQLVGWFQGRMEWGSRALGNRSILANPVGPYTLENLNAFLKQREPHRSYSVSVCTEDMPRYFRGPAASPFMEFEYDVEDPDLLRTLMPFTTTRLRVQSVGEAPELFRRLLKAFESVAGIPILVNTSFNGFHEPIVCTPRDAVRVFYGTGLDMAVIGNFVLRK